MADEDREQTHYLATQIGELQKEPYSFGFFQTLRLIECLYPNAPRLGTSRRPAGDPIRLAQEPSMRFESASLTAFEPQVEGKPHRLTVRLLGLLGPNGPLPLHLTEYAQERLQKYKDPTFTRFLDIFHHRMLSLFYRAWKHFYIIVFVKPKGLNLRIERSICHREREILSISSPQYFHQRPIS